MKALVCGCDAFEYGTALRYLCVVCEADSFRNPVGRKREAARDSELNSSYNYFLCGTVRSG
jgi:hypothetical protein